MPDTLLRSNDAGWSNGIFNAGGAVATVQPNTPMLPPSLSPSGGSASTSTGVSAGVTAGSIVKNLPSWIPRSPDALTGELSDQYGKVNDAFSTGAVDAASEQQQARDLSSGLQAANSAATEYSARVRQQGGSSAASGLIRAEGQVKAMDTAGQAKVEAVKYDVAQREAAAGQSAQIAQTLAGLRTSYLGTLAGIATGQTSSGTQSTTQSSENQTIDGKPYTGPGGGANGSGSGGDYVQNLGGGIIPADAGRAYYGGG